jgi:hypothetical protein
MYRLMTTFGVDVTALITVMLLECVLRPASAPDTTTAAHAATPPASRTFRRDI